MIKRREFNNLLLISMFLPFPVIGWSRLLVDEEKLFQIPMHFIYEKNSVDYGFIETPAFNDVEKIHYIEGDITRVWYEELHFFWKNKTILTAGLTRESEFFVLKTLARDYGYRVKHETQQADIPLVLWLLAPVEFSSQNLLS